VTLQVRVSQHAQRDVETILTWLSERSPPGAERWFEKYLETLHKLSERAAGCPLAPEASFTGRELRQLLFKTRRGHTYRSLFLIDGDFIQLLAVRGSGQDLATAEELGLD
jgi:plasmid stabilization system protein ParE